MPRPTLDFSGAQAASEPLLRTTHAARRHITGFWDGFVDFAFNDNVLHVAIGLMFVFPFLLHLHPIYHRPPLPHVTDCTEPQHHTMGYTRSLTRHKNTV